jgi:hypothetical protein
MSDQAFGPGRPVPAKKRLRTTGAYDRDLTRVVDYGEGPVEETIGRQTVVDAYAPGSVEPIAVTDKAWAHVYSKAGFSLEPQPDQPEVSMSDTALELDRLANEAEAERRGRERAEAAAREAERLRSEAVAELARLRAKEPAASGGKAGRS